MPWKMDSTKFIQAMKEIAGEVQLDMHDVMRQQMGLWVQDIILKIYNDPKLGSGDQFRLAKGAVSKDVYKVFFPVKDASQIYEKGRAKKLGKAISEDMLKTDYGTSGINGYPMVKDNSGAVYLIEPERLMTRPTMETIKQVHDKHRRAGRVHVALKDRKHKSGLNIAGRYAVRASLLKRYIRETQKEVGGAKASWMKAYRFFQSRVSSAAGLPWKPQNWIARHGTSQDAHGLAGEHVDKMAMTGEWYGGSDLEWGIRPHDALARTWPTRQKDIEKGYALQRIQKTLNAHRAMVG